MVRFRKSGDNAGSAVPLCYSYNWRRSGFVLVSLGWVFYIAHFQRQWFGANESTTRRGRPRNYDPESLDVCPDNERLQLSDELNCVSRCRPSKSQEVANFDPEETIKIVMPQIFDDTAREYKRHELYFPEEEVHVKLAASLVGAIDKELDEAGFGGAIFDKGFLQPRPITERLLRRIVAKLLRAGVVDPTRTVVDIGSFIGDNAIPWAIMMEELSQPDDPGKVVAIDPSRKFLRETVNLANVNYIDNICTKRGILSSDSIEVLSIGHTTEHIGVRSEAQLARMSAINRAKFEADYDVQGLRMHAFPLDSLSLRDITLLHIDVEGHESEVLRGAVKTIKQSRPIIISEVYTNWPDGDEKDVEVNRLMRELGYDRSDEIPEVCGLKSKARNRIFWPDKETEMMGRAIIREELEHELVPWIADELQ